MKVLLVEDEVEYFLNIKNFLEVEHGFKVLMTEDNSIVDSFAKVNLILKKILPDFAIIDIELENSSKNGIEIAKILRSLNIPFITITNYDTTKNLISLEKLFSQAIIGKTKIIGDLRQLNNAIYSCKSNVLISKEDPNTILIRSKKQPNINKKDSIDQIEVKRTAEDYKFVKFYIENIKCFKTINEEKNYISIIVDFDETPYYYTQYSLTEMTHKLSNKFIRPNSQHLINVNQIESFSVGFTELTLIDKQKIVISRTFKNTLIMQVKSNFPIIINKGQSI